MAFQNNPAAANYNWGSSKRRYEWRAEYNDGVAPRDEALEKELFSEETHVHSGINFNKYNNISVKVEGDNPPPGFDRVRYRPADGRLDH